MAIATIEILDGKLEQFKEILVELMDHVSKTEPDTLIYNWYINKEGTICQLYRTVRQFRGGNFSRCKLCSF